MSEASRLPVLLSQVLVAFAIEFDNEFEARLAKTWARPFKVSMVMWSNFMRFIGEEGVRLGDVVSLSRIRQSAVVSVVGGMERWGYIAVDHDPRQGTPGIRKGFGTARGLKLDTMIYPSMTGKLAKEIWEPLVGETEERWKARLGGDRVEQLRDALAAVHRDIHLAMPHFLPVLGGDGLFADAELDQAPSQPDAHLQVLLSRVLLGFTLDHEKGSEISLPLGANVLRVLDERGLPLKDLPSATGVSKEAVAVSLTWLEKSGYVTTEPHPEMRGKVARITAKGGEARAAFERRLDEVEDAWESRFGKDRVSALRSALQYMLDQPGGEEGPLSAGLVPPPGGWRDEGRYKRLTAAFIDSPRDALPHYPMVLHRGGWPDGS